MLHGTKGIHKTNREVWLANYKQHRLKKEYKTMLLEGGGDITGILAQEQTATHCCSITEQLKMWVGGHGGRQNSFPKRRVSKEGSFENKTSQ